MIPRLSSIRGDKEATNIISGGVRRAIITLSLLTGIFLLAMYTFLAKGTSLSHEQIQTVMFLIVSADSVFLALSLKRLDTSIFKTNIFDNRWLLGAITISVGVLAIAFITPPLTSVLSIVSVPMWGTSYSACQRAVPHFSDRDTEVYDIQKKMG